MVHNSNATAEDLSDKNTESLELERRVYGDCDHRKTFEEFVRYHVREDQTLD